MSAKYSLIFFSLISSCYSQTFFVAVAPAALTVYPGQQNIPLQIRITGTYSSPLTVTLSGLPSGIAVQPLALNGSNSGTLVLNASMFAGQEGFSKTDLGIPTSWTAPPVTVVAASGSLQAKSTLALSVSISNPAFAPAAGSINLPIVKIDTKGVGITSGDVDVPGTITITSADGQVSHLPNAGDSDNTATFHVHGHTTALMPKLAYNVKLKTSLDLMTEMGVACPYLTSAQKPICDKSKSYLLLANYDDKTFIRNWAALALANAIPIGGGYLDSAPNSPTPSGTSALMPWAPHSVFVELYLDGVYRGNYQLTESVKLDSHKVNITELSETDTAPEGITGGYLLEIDEHQDETFTFTTPQGVPIGLDDPDFAPDPDIAAQTSYISGYVNSAETALYSADFTDPVKGWRAYFDEASVVNFYIVNDLMGNVDGGEFYSSDYFYKAANNPLLYMGPVWDFDISSGNVNYAPISDPTSSWMQSQALWYVQWFRDPVFKANVTKQWNALKNNGVLAAWMDSVRQQAANLKQSQVNNFGRWPMQGIQIWPNAEVAGSYDGEVAYLTNWLTLRMAYLDSILNDKAQTRTVLSAPSDLRTGTPAALSAQVTGTTFPSGAVSFLASGVLLGTATVDNGGTARLSVSLPAGDGSLQAVYSGDSTNALSASASQPVSVAAALSSSAISLAVDQSTAGIFTASVIGNTGTSIPTGNALFSVDSGAPVKVPLDQTGKASYTATAIAGGAHSVSASYSGDGNYSATSSTPVIFEVGRGTGTPLSVSVDSILSAASYGNTPLAADGYSVVFGTGLSTQTMQATTVSPLPVVLGGTSLSVTDIQGNKLQASLYYVSPTQINFVVPHGLAAGAASLTIRNATGRSGTVTGSVATVAPALFSGNASGKGAAAAVVLQVRTDGSSTVAPSYSCDGSPLVCRTLPINVTQAGTTVYLSLYGTGIRGAGSFSDTTVTIGGVSAKVLYAGAQNTYPGLDQINVQIPVSLAGSGEVPLQVTVNGVQANSLLVNIQ